MIRSVYCPDMGMLSEATQLADKLKLPIIVGDCKNLDGLQFDRTSVCALNIPDEHKLVIARPEIRQNLSQIIDYTNDFADLMSDGLLTTVNDLVLEPQLLEHHRARYSYRSGDIGVKTVVVSVNDMVVAEVDYKVIE